MSTIHKDIKDAIIRSQHCQRNWDLDQKIPQEDLDLILYSVTECPSKQNVAHYKVHVITNRDIIEKIHDNTAGFTARDPRGPGIIQQTNSQTLANLLLVFEECSIEETAMNNPTANNETLAVANSGSSTDTEQHIRILTKDRQMAVGVAAGYANMVATMLGYATGCCACFDTHAINEILELENNVLLMMGIGFKNAELNRRVHHLDSEFVFPTKPKQPISVTFIE